MLRTRRIWRRFAVPAISQRPTGRRILLSVKGIPNKARKWIQNFISNRMASIQDTIPGSPPKDRHFHSPSSPASDAALVDQPVDDKGRGICLRQRLFPLEGRLHIAAENLKRVQNGFPASHASFPEQLPKRTTKTAPLK